MEEVRTVKFWRALRGEGRVVVGDVELLPGVVLRRRWEEVPERRYSVSRERRLGRTVTMVGIVDAGAPFSRKSLKRGSCERTEMRMVGGTPAHLPSSRCVNVLPRGSDQPCKTRGGPSMHQMDIFRRPVRVMSSAQTCSPKSEWVRMVSSRKGRVRRTVRKEMKSEAKVVDESSTHVIERRLVHRERALRVSAVMFGYCGRTPRWIVPVSVTCLTYWARSGRRIRVLEGW